MQTQIPDPPICLVLEDDPGILKVLGSFLKAKSQNRFQVETTNSVADAVKLIAKGVVKLVIYDQTLVKMNGEELVSEAKNKQTLTIMISGFQSGKGKYDDFIPKPFHKEQLEKLSRLLKKIFG